MPLGGGLSEVRLVRSMTQNRNRPTRSCAMRWPPAAPLSSAFANGAQQTVAVGRSVGNLWRATGDIKDHWNGKENGAGWVWGIIDMNGTQLQRTRPLERSRHARGG